MNIHTSNLSILLIAFAFVFTACGDKETPERVLGCNTNTPGFGENLGTVSFVTNQTWTIENDSILQIWSDAVQATNCSNRDTFWTIHDFHNYNADCRSNPEHKGDLFSWCAVYRFADVLCPAPWRVPTEQDFIDLDIAMGGTGANRLQQTVNGHSWQAQITWFTNTWGGAFGGRANFDGRMEGQGSWARYWSITENSDLNAAILGFTSLGAVNPRGNNAKEFGFTLRCIK